MMAVLWVPSRFANSIVWWYESVQYIFPSSPSELSMAMDRGCPNFEGIMVCRWDPSMFAFSIFAGWRLVPSPASAQYMVLCVCARACVCVYMCVQCVCMCACMSDLCTTLLTFYKALTALDVLSTHVCKDSTKSAIFITTMTGYCQERIRAGD